jgi:hypothetical protein
MLQNAPMYSYIPAKDVARARKFYEEKLAYRSQRLTSGLIGLSDPLASLAGLVRSA